MRRLDDVRPKWQHSLAAERQKAVATLENEEALRTLAASDPDPSVREAARQRQPYARVSGFRQLRDSTNPEGDIDELIGMIDTSEPELREAARTKLVELMIEAMADDRSQARILRWSGTLLPSVQSLAITTACRVADLRFMEPLLRVAETHKLNALGPMAINALATQKDPRAARPLMQMLSSYDRLSSFGREQFYNIVNAIRVGGDAEVINVLSQGRTRAMTLRTLTGQEPSLLRATRLLTTATAVLPNMSLLPPTRGT